jgi:hypothetical protein
MFIKRIMICLNLNNQVNHRIILNPKKRMEIQRVLDKVLLQQNVIYAYSL